MLHYRKSMIYLGVREGLKSTIAYTTVKTRSCKDIMKEVGARHIRMAQALILYLVWLVEQEEVVVE